MTIKSDHRALYLQVIDRMKQDIASGVYKEKEKLPSEFELSKSLGVSRATLREALRLLEEDNVIVRRHGVGTFVNSKPVFSSGIEELTSVSDMIRQAGMEPGVVYLSTSESVCSEEDVNRFHCNPDDTVISIERVRTANGEPVVYCIDKVPSVYMPEGFLGRKESSIFSALEESGDIRISYAVTFIDPTGYHEEASPILECDPETALLVLKQHHYDENDRLVLYSKNYFRADKFSFHVVRKRL
ncbi:MULTISPECIES: GntR family transcriptional regulator [unclassified Planococcus (in: firmicutes)]|uniref:GntR family transcriptional regulator n=1 Tax=Planococcus TaxID=1372 RepID=UPI000C32D0E9|nr:MULTISPECIES: GntR family transcriptional regulator [unclassified Planococcus (in: firmicutes)]MDN5707822.1 GntR family transcriptional regulator [Planococcus sp. (in: firmicutes)]AUD14079.1 GntR family transcriptional regulator [Planococcus sp. MB-3u-03]PKG48088.1 GntR family transcriptional regulator [Planococcus sp. Urea-trap-24]PKG91936.1 GntR family transcriptional regulator [Planococcus sp. Urea-3u-39]PKH43160.1 GntR family transcriptional regulator [Planococcus sp. MB-3u-09]